jgi:nitroreductase
MELRDAIRRRRMVRNFEDRPVPADALDRILDHARRAPSAGHTQGSAFLVLEGPEQTAAFWD